MKTLALVLLSLLAFSHAQETPEDYFYYLGEGIIRGLQGDSEGTSICLTSYLDIATKGADALLDFSKLTGVDIIRSLEDITRAMDSIVNAIKQGGRNFRFCNFEENVSQLQNFFAGPGAITSLTLQLNQWSETGVLFAQMWTNFRTGTWKDFGIYVGQYLHAYYQFTIQDI